eukprot:4572778-Pyramimonas_sp.AAC.1
MSGWGGCEPPGRKDAASPRPASRPTVSSWGGAIRLIYLIAAAALGSSAGWRPGGPLGLRAAAAAAGRHAAVQSAAATCATSPT